MSSADYASAISLNPFEIRASVQLQRVLIRTVRLSLNPFEIRASVQLTKHGPFAVDENVSIPLKSGHRFNLCYTAKPVQKITSQSL